MNETMRLAALRDYGILDTPNEERFDRLTRITAALLDVPIVLVTLVDEHRQWFKSTFGLEISEAPRENSFCHYAIMNDQVMEVRDAQSDARFASHPSVVAAPFVRFYAGAPLQTRAGYNVGVLCAFDRRPRALDGSQRRLMADVAAMVVEAMESYRTHDDLLKNSALMRAVVERSEDAIFVKDREGDYLLINDSGAAVLGCDQARVAGRSDRDFLPAALAASLQAVDQQVIASGQAATVEEQIPTPSGMRTFLTVKAPLADDRGAVIGVVGIARDITERKAVEAALVQAKEQADKANAAKSDFLSAMSHELRTPLNALLGFSQMLGMNKTEPLGPVQQKCVNHILLAGQHLLTLVNDILDLARIEAGLLNLSPATIDLQDTLGECLALVQPLAAERGITIILGDAPDALSLVRADPVRLTQVLVNLLTNAIKYNRPAGCITLTETVTDQGRRHLAITDTGPGLTPSQLAQLFEPFNRLGAETTCVEGLGIGLSLSRRLVLLMDGEIGATSRLGEGSTFWVELPVPA